MLTSFMISSSIAVILFVVDDMVSDKVFDIVSLMVDVVIILDDMVVGKDCVIND